MKEGKNLKIKKGDEVIILAGKDRGKKGKVIKVLPKRGAVVVEGLNLVKKHRHPKRQGEKGEIISVPRPIDVSKVAIWCSTCGRQTRVGYRFDGDKKLRICKRCQQLI
ncbi:MAG TPA: 50S ribosomal protein L24 [Candidatus Paceibacterota bacterium]|nr:50S ribosomal protein L24 [Candidatus Paceibacterota bacterium]HOL54014.1 50S ribosomal protein L24 [Candidatus Paceibacterota bacterium]HON21764.1 50S ribosomal protein L24 [Candidatus Paceibacterota bacterium]HOV88598.1 50S ribosomal protein L24 [Candidatus Paceibacterota bacterium]HPP17065.1 50S ribosomal protein L24 [Candidatus Paceibacterota bacterium]